MPSEEFIENERRVIHDLLADVAENKAFSLLGAKISSPKDLALLGEVYRSPRYETFHYLFTRNGEVVGTTAVSCRRIDTTYTFFGDDPKAFHNKIFRQAKKLNADCCYFLHNHPSGDPTPSYMDLRITQTYIEELINNTSLSFGGHVIVNSNRYSVIKEDKSFATFPINYSSYNLEEMRKSNSFFGASILAPRELAALAKTLQKSQDKFLAVGLNTKMNCNCLYEVGYDIFAHPGKKLKQAIQNWSLASGVKRYALVNFSEEKLKTYDKEKILGSIRESGIVLDIISDKGVSLRESFNIDLKHRPYWDLNKKTYEVQDWQLDYNDEVQPEFDFEVQIKEEEEDESAKNRKKNQRNSAISRHSNSHGTSGNGKHSTSAEPSGQRNESPVDERFGELFMWASRSRTQTAIRTATEKPANDLHGKAGDSNEGNLRSADKPPGSESPADSTPKRPVEDLQGNLRDLDKKKVVAQYKIVETVHSLKGHNLFVVQLPQRVDKEHFKEILSQAKSLNGYYSKFSRNDAIPGFQFKEKENAQKFIALLQKEVIQEKTSADLINGIEVPLSAQAAIVAVFKNDDSDPMTDYYASKTLNKVLLGFSNHTKDLFSEMRKYALLSKNPKIRKLGEKGSEEHREKYSMGGGYYLKNGNRHSTGWEVRKYAMYDNNRENFLEAISKLELDEYLRATIQNRQEQKQIPENDDFGIDWDNLENFRAEIEAEGLAANQESQEVPVIKSSLPSFDYDNLPELTSSQIADLESVIKDYFISAKIKKMDSSGSVILKTRNFPNLSGIKFEARMKELDNLLAGKLDKTLCRRFYIQSAPTKLLMLDQLTKAEEIPLSNLRTVLSPGKYQYLGDNLLILARQYKYDFKKVTKNCPDQLLKLVSVFEDPNDLKTVLSDLSYWINTRLNGEFDTVENILADLPDVIQNNFSVSASNFKQAAIHSLFTNKEPVEEKEVREIRQAKEIYEEIKVLITEENGIINLADFHKELNKIMGFDGDLNVKTRVSAYAHAYTDEDLSYDSYGWVSPQFNEAQEIKFKSMKKDWASLNSITLRQYPNQYYGAAYSIFFGSGGSSSPVQLFNSKLYKSPEQAICLMADKMIAQFAKSDSKEARFYLKEAHRVKAEYGNYMGELFDQKSNNEISSNLIKDKREKVSQDIPKNKLVDSSNEGKHLKIPPPERNRNNFRINDPEKLAPAGDISKIKANILAVKTLKQIEAEDRAATSHEKEVLSHYVGWGGLKNIFNRYETPIKWAGYAEEIKELLTDEEWRLAAQSVLNSHYTSPDVISAMWQAALQLGFKGGHVLEPAAGIGHFIGLMPKELQNKCHIHTVECDSLSARILSKLYPDAHNQESYFEYASAKNNSMDLIISNVPFLDNPHRDPKYPKMHLHDYFFNRGIDLLKPGGVMMAISTCASLDSLRSRKSRKILSKKADMIAAVRLPSNTFKKNAGAEVTTDIIVLRKKDQRKYEGHNFVSVKGISRSEQLIETRTNKEGEEEDVYKSIEVNEYFIEHPEMMLGEMQLTKSRFGDGLEQSLVATDENLGAALDQAVKKLPAGLMNKVEVEEDYKALIAGDEIKPYSFMIDDRGEVVQKIDGFLEKAEGFESENMKKRAADFIELRDLAVEAVNTQVKEDLSDDEVEKHRLALCRKFAEFEKRHGSPWNGNIQRQFRLDPEFALILSLQESTSVIEDGKIKSVQRPSGLLKKRTAWPLRLPEKAKTIEDALQISLAYKGGIDLKWISELTENTQSDCTETIISQGLAFIEPQSGLLINKADYLSGNVREKLALAEAFLKENPEYEINVKALKEVQPEDIGIDAINFRLGSQWIDAEVLNQWSKSCLSGSLGFRYSDLEHKWYMSGTCTDDPALSTERVSTKRLIEVTLALRNIEVFDVIRDGKSEKRVLNEKETAYALEKQAALRENFIDYVKNSPEAYKKVEEDYNRSFNSFAPKEYSVPPIKYFPGAAQIMEGRNYQKSAIVRAVHEPTLLAHAVGAGKTFEIITAVMEKKRLGIARKSMIVVQNATVAQFATFAKSLYPNSKILAPLSKTEYAAKNRQLFLSRIASNDWDAVIIPQSFFNLIKDDPEFVKSYYEERIEEYKAAKEESSDKITVRNMEKAIERFQAMADSYTHQKGDDTLNFSQLGVDCLVLDEAHEYKKVGIATAMGPVKGLDTGVSQRAQRAYMKIRYIREKSNGRNVIPATGTPITNTLAELYTMLRLTNEKTLEAYGIHEFDQFAAVFTEAVTAPELTATNKLKMVTRLSKFINQPELIRMFRTSADVITGNQLSKQKGVEKPQIIGGRPQAVVIPRGEWLGSYIDMLQAELEQFENMSGKERKKNSHIPLTVMSRARKAAIDPRLLGYVEGMGFAPDDKNSKSNTVVKEIIRIAAETDDLNGTQMVFSDLYQSPDGKFNLFKDMKAKLIETGMPAEQIAIIHDYTTDAQRERLFADMNAGRVRVLFGTTERMGVGVNAQERMKAMHHMDAPWMPMQMEQRIGRIVRHGNIYAHNGGVYVQTYGVEKTMDAAIFQKILTKQRFIEAILEGNVNERVIEDESSDMALSAQEFTALFSGNPDVMRKFELESEIKTLRIQKDSWRRQMRTSRDRLEKLTEKLDALEEILPLAKEKLKELQEYAKTFEQNRKVEINGQLVADDKIKESLNSFVNRHLAKAALMALASDKNEFSMDIPDSLSVNGKKLNLKILLFKDIVGDEVSHQIAYGCENSQPFDISGKVSSGFGVLSSFTKAVCWKPQELYQELGAKLKSARQDKISTEDFLSKPFRREEELKLKESELSSIVLDSETAIQVTEKDSKNVFSPFRAWLQKQNLEELALKADFNADQEEMIIAFQEEDRDNLPLELLWKLEAFTNKENVFFLNEEIKQSQVEPELLEAYKRVSSALERAKQRESSIDNLDKLKKELRCLSITMHGYCNNKHKTWDHGKAQWVKEAFVPALRKKKAKTQYLEYSRELIRRYNVSLGDSSSSERYQSTPRKIKL